MPEMMDDGMQGRTLGQFRGPGKSEMNQAIAEKMIQPVNIPPVPPVKRVRLGWWRTIPHTIRIYYYLRLQRMKLAILEWLGVDQLIRNEANARKENDATNLQLLQRKSSQLHRIALQMPALIEAKKRLEFYENDEILRHAKKRWMKANKSNLEKINARGHDDRDGGGAGAGAEVPEGPGPDAAGEVRKGGVRRTPSDGASSGRDEVQGVAPTRHEIIRNMMDSDEATANMGGARTMVKCDLCEATDSRANPGDPCPCGGGTYRLLLRATRNPA